MSGSVSKEMLQSYCSEHRFFVLQHETTCSFNNCSSRYAELEYARLSGVLHWNAFLFLNKYSKVFCNLKLQTLSKIIKINLNFKN